MIEILSLSRQTVEHSLTSAALPHVHLGVVELPGTGRDHAPKHRCESSSRPDRGRPRRSKPPQRPQRFRCAP